jgi:hypothetical protein
MNHTRCGVTGLRAGNAALGGPHPGKVGPRYGKWPGVLTRGDWDSRWLARELKTSGSGPPRRSSPGNAR